MSERKTSFLRFLWGIFPWLVVLLIVIFIVSLGTRINKEKARLEREKKEAMKKEIKPTQVIISTLRSVALQSAALQTATPPSGQGEIPYRR